MVASLEGRIALITGASSGIGRETTKELISRGAKVIVNHYPSDEAEQDTRERPYHQNRGPKPNPMLKTGAGR